MGLPTGNASTRVAIIFSCQGVQPIRAFRRPCRCCWARVASSVKVSNYHRPAYGGIHPRKDMQTQQDRGISFRRTRTAFRRTRTATVLVRLSSCVAYAAAHAVPLRKPAAPFGFRSFRSSFLFVAEKLQKLRRTTVRIFETQQSAILQ